MTCNRQQAADNNAKSKTIPAQVFQRPARLERAARRISQDFKLRIISILSSQNPIKQNQKNKDNPQQREETTLISNPLLAGRSRHTDIRRVIHILPNWRIHLIHPVYYADDNDHG